jgi:H+/Cl- antiporter ClcA
MSPIACPQCGELNDPSSFHCAACGASLNVDDIRRSVVPPGTWSILAAENIKNLLGIVIGGLVILLGIYVPGLASMLIQLVLIFTSDNRYQRRALSDAKPGNADGWWVIAVGIICILFSGMALYTSWKKARGKET